MGGSKSNLIMEEDIDFPIQFEACYISLWLSCILPFEGYIYLNTYVFQQMLHHLKIKHIFLNHISKETNLLEVYLREANDLDFMIDLFAKGNH